MKHVALAALLLATAVSLLAAVAMRRQRDSAVDLAADSLETSEAALRALRGYRQAVEDLMDATPVYMIAGLPMAENMPEYTGICLN